MKLRILIIITTLLLPLVSSAVEINDYMNNRHCDQVLDKQFYKICYSYSAKGALFVAYKLKGSDVNAVNIKKRPRFYPDKAIPSQYRTYPNDYTHNEFHADRGHLASDATFDWSKKSLHAVYSMANIIPQYYKINRMTWSKAERYARLVATQLGEVTIINGVNYGNPPLTRMRKSGIAYPKAYWKMIFNNEKGFQRCFYYKNNKNVTTKGDKLRNHLVSCQKLKMIF